MPRSGRAPDLPRGGRSAAAICSRRRRDPGRCPAARRRTSSTGTAARRSTEPGSDGDDAALVHRLAVLPEDGQVDPREVAAEPGAPDHVRHVERPTALEHRKAVPDPHHPRDPFHAGSEEVLRLDSDQRVGLPAGLAEGSPAEGGPLREHVVSEEADQDEEVLPRSLDPDRDVPRLLPGEPGVVRPHDLERDVGPRVPRADEQDAAFAELRRPAVLARVQLHDRWVELARERGLARNPMGSGRHDDVVRLEPTARGREDEPIPLPGERLHVAAGPDVEPEPFGIGLQVVRHLILRREGPPGRGEAEAGQAVVASRREEPQRVPTRAPRVADPLVGVQDHGRPAPSLQEVPRREARLASADDHGLDPLRSLGAHRILRSLGTRGP